MKKVLANSNYNYITIDNPYKKYRPFVIFTFSSVPTEGSYILYVKQSSGLSEGKNIVFTNNPKITASNCYIGNQTTYLYYFVECLKLNTVFYDIQIIGDNAVRAGIDSSAQYSFTVNGPVSANYAMQNPYDSKIVLNVTEKGYEKDDEFITAGTNTNERTFSLESDNMFSDKVYFDPTSPFNLTTFKYPIDIKLSSYVVSDVTITFPSLPYTEAVVMPTSLPKYEGVDYNNYYNGEGVKRFLTRNVRRRYNYGEYIALSILSDYGIEKMIFRKRYYTNSDVFLGETTGARYTERKSIRTDFYDVLDLDTIESNTGKQVGYVLVDVVITPTVISEPIRYDVVPTCSGNHSLFFVNSIGGIDSFNFDNNEQIDIKPKIESKYFKSGINGMNGGTYDLENVGVRSSNSSYDLTVKNINKTTAYWLHELGDSKYVFYFLGENASTKFVVVIVDKLNTSINENKENYDVSLTYHESDAQLLY